MDLCDYNEALSWSERETSRPRNAESGVNEVLHYPQQIILHGSMGELKQVRRLMRETSNERVQSSGRSYLAFWSGEFETLETELSAYVALVRQQLKSVCNAGFLLPRVDLLSGNYRRAEQLLLEGISDSVLGGHVAMELIARQCLAYVYAEMECTNEAREQLIRCREIMTAGEDWRGLSGMVEWSEAALAMAEKRSIDALHQFAVAIETIRRYSIRWAEGPVLRDWGRAFLATDQRERARAKFDQALELYRRIGAGQPWIDRILAEKQSAGL
jgi:hypothetical protein